MKLLILTQKIDQNDTVLGFFHTWVREIAVQCEFVTVIALGVGEYNLPKNVHVLSLGKEEKHHSRFRYVLRFYRYVWMERKNYDTVFVHMNDEYVVLGGWLWRLLGKKIYHWRNHPKGGWMIDLAMRFSHLVYATSSYSYVKQRYPDRVTLMPAGIDTEVFHPSQSSQTSSRSLLFFGRLSPIKKVDLFLEALLLLKQQQISFTASIVGDPHNAEDGAYVESLTQFIATHDLSDVVTISPGIPNHQAPELYCRHDIYVNLTTTGSFDKTIFEAMATGMLVVTTNGALRGEIPEVFLAKECDAEDIAAHLAQLLASTGEERSAYGQGLREYVIKNHSLKELLRRFFVDWEVRDYNTIHADSTI